jgi:hypothetical protein
VWWSAELLGGMTSSNLIYHAKLRMTISIPGMLVGVEGVSVALFGMTLKVEMGVWSSVQLCRRYQRREEPCEDK